VKKLRGSLVAGTLVLTVNGCGVTEHIQDGSVVSRSYQLGAYERPACDPETSSLISTTFLGISASQQGATLGYAQDDLVCIPFECKAVFWVKDPAVIDEVKTLIGDNTQMCAINKTGEQIE